MTDTLFTIPDWLTADILREWITDGERDPDPSPKMLAQLEAEAQYPGTDQVKANSDRITGTNLPVTAAQEATSLPFPAAEAQALPSSQQDVNSPGDVQEHKDDPLVTTQTTNAAIVTPVISTAQTCLDSVTLDEHQQRGETGDAEIVATLYANHSAGQWYVWNRQYWAMDLTQQVGNLVSSQVGGQYLRAAAEALETGDKSSAHARQCRTFPV